MSAVTAVAVMAGPAAAESLVIRKVDTTKYPQVKISALVSGATPSLGAFRLRENGQLVNGMRVVPLGQTDTLVGVVLVVDTSGSMRAKSKLDLAKAAAKQFINEKRPNEQIAIVAFSETARVASNFTADAGLLTGVIDGLTATGETALYDAVRLATGLLVERPDLQPNLVVLSDGKDTVSIGTAEQAKAAVQSSNAVAFSIGLIGSDFDAGFLRDIGSVSNGGYVETADPTALSGLYTRVRDSLQNQYEITYTSAPGPTGGKAVDLMLSVGALQQRANVAVGGVAKGKATQPEAIKESGLPSILTGSSGRWVIVILAFLAMALLAFGLILIFVRDRSALESAMRSYNRPFADKEADDDPENDGSLVDTALIRRAVAATGRLAEERGLLVRVEAKLDQADLPLRPAEAIFFTGAMLIIMVVLGLAVGRLLGALFALILFGLGPIVVLNYLSGRRKRIFTSQLPDTLQLLAGSLRAGYSLLQGVDAVAQQIENPMGKELGRALSEARLGRSVDDALADVATRMGSPDFDWAVMAVRIQREVGGNLAELLMTVADTMVARERLRRDVKALTAEGRISAIVLGIMPVSLGVLLFVLNPDYMGKLFHSSLGRGMLGGSILLALFGFWWMKKTIEVEI